MTISQNGEIVAVGARYNDGNGTHAGHARVFQLNGSEWQQLGGDIDGAAELFRHGDAVALSQMAIRLQLVHQKTIQLVQVLVEHRFMTGMA